MRIALTLKSSFGCSGGIVIYMISKAAAGIANIGVRREELNSNTINIMKPLFPHLNLEHIRIRPGSTIPPNWFKRRTKYVAITFGYTIYCSATDIQNTNENLNVLMHELVHADQVRRRDDSIAKFAGDYGKGYLHAGNYRNNPLEEEAFNFVNLNRLPES